MCNPYVFCSVLGMSSFMHIIVNNDIHALRQSMGRENLRDVIVHMVLSAYFYVICAVRLSL